jgi:hypothetical protein
VNGRVLPGFDILILWSSGRTDQEVWQEMKGLDQKSSLFWMAFSLIVVKLSLDLGVGTLARPGSGFLPGLAAACMFVLASVVFISSLGARKKSRLFMVPGGVLRVLCILFALISYALVLERIGFLIAAFLLMSAMLFGIGKQKVIVVFLFSVLSSFGAFALFQLWLKTPLPKGFLGF